MSRQHVQAFGVLFETSLELPGAAAAGAGPAVSVEPATCGQAASWPRGREVWRSRIDGRPVRLQRAANDELWLAFGDATFVVAPGGASVACVPGAEGRSPSWQRFLLDTVLTCVALERGGIALHASAVCADRGAVAIVGHTGGGKSTLAAALVARGHRLLCDDVLFLDRGPGDVIVGHRGPPVMSLDRRTDPALLAAVGAPLARLDDEVWLLTAPAESTPTPLTAVCLLERRAGAALRVERVPATALTLLPHALGRGDLPPSYARRRFELLSDLAGTAPVWRVVASTAAPARALADAVEAAWSGRS